jgi:hypothetical protein
LENLNSCPLLKSTTSTSNQVTLFESDEIINNTHPTTLHSF